MKFEPTECNPCHPKYEKWDWWTKDIVENLVLRYHAQGGTEYSSLQPWMIGDFEKLLEEMGGSISVLHSKAFRILGS